jgi:hypothetical protein
VKDWLRELIYTLDPFHHQAVFLTFFLQALTLHRLISLPSRTPLDFVQKSKCMTTRRPEKFVRSKQGDYILLDVYGAIANDQRFSISQGILFIKYVLFALFSGRL